MSRSDRWSVRVESPRQSTLELRPSGGATANDYSRSLPSGSRLSARRLRELAGDLSDRDWRVLRSLQTVRVLTGAQAERLLFGEIQPSARGRIRRRVLGRLVGSGLVTTLKRRIGGVRAGSSGLVYALSAAGQRLLDVKSNAPGPRRRPAYTPGALFLAHALAVSEVYVSLHDAARTRSAVRVEEFAVEVDARFSSASGEVLRPDALVVLSTGEVEDVWWLEIDRGSESIPRLRAMLRRYLSLVERGETGPRGVLPRVLLSVPDERRLHAVRGLVRQLPPPGSELFVVCREAEVAAVLVKELLDEVREPP